MGRTKYLESFILGGETVRVGEFVRLHNGIVGEVTCIWEHHRTARCELKLLYPPDHTVSGALPWNGKAELLPSLEVTEAEPPQLDKKCQVHSVENYLKSNNMNEYYKSKDSVCLVYNQVAVQAPITEELRKSLSQPTRMQRKKNYVKKNKKKNKKSTQKRSISPKSRAEEDDTPRKRIYTRSQTISDDEELSTPSEGYSTDEFIVDDDDVIEHQVYRPPVIYSDEEEGVSLVVQSNIKMSEAFRIYVEFIFRTIIDKGFVERMRKNKTMHNFYQPVISKIEKKITDQKDIEVTSSSVWNPIFIQYLEMYPNRVIEPATGLAIDCEACNRSGHTSSHVITFRGHAYDSHLFWKDSAVKFIKENQSKSRVFHLGRNCFSRSELYHRLHHYKYNLRLSVLKVVRKLDYNNNSNAEEDPRVELFKEYDEVNDFITQEYRKFKTLISNVDSFINSNSSHTSTLL